MSLYRVVAATKKLRAMIQADRQRTTTTTATASTAATTSDSGVTDQDTADKTMDTDVTYVVDGNGSSSATTSAAVDSTSSTDVAGADADNSDVVAHTDSTTTSVVVDAVAAESKETEQNERTQEQQQYSEDIYGQRGAMEVAATDSNTQVYFH